MSDEEGYNSEEDADYVPSDGELGSEEENSGDEEDFSVLADDAGTAKGAGGKRSRNKKENKASGLAPRKRKGGIKLDGEEGGKGEGTNGDTEENKELAEKLKQEANEKKIEKEKKKADDLWSSFLSDVKPHARPVAKTTQSSTPTTQVSGKAATQTSAASSSCSSSSTPAAGDAKRAGEKITITTVFDFAGEEVRVTKQVDANSKEAKAELKKQEEEQQQQQENEKAQRLGASSLSSTSSASPSLPTSSSSSSILGAKRPAAAAPAAAVGGGLGGLLNKIGKKQKMSTLEKSKMDWDSFKKKEGIEEDLKIHNKGKDGYIERMAFLNRADVRQYEIERDLRLSKSGKR